MEKNETNLEKAKRLIKAHAEIQGIELADDNYFYKMLDLAATPDLKCEGKGTATEAENPSLNKIIVMGRFNDGIFYGIRQCNSEFQVMLQQIYKDFTDLKRIRKKDVEIILNGYANIELGEDVNPFLENAPE